MIGIQDGYHFWETSTSDEALVVVSNRPMNKETITTYRRRWEIETMFGALKSRGFNFEESKISEEHKVEKLMALLSISFVWSILAGEYRQKQNPIALKKMNQKIYKVKSLVFFKTSQ